MKQNEQMNEALNEAMNELIPYGYYYNIKGRNISSATKNPTKEQYKSFIKLYIYDNNDTFIATIKTKNETDFKKELDIQLSYYSEKAKDLTEWLKHTERLIVKNITDRYLIYALKGWLNIQTQLTPQQNKPVSKVDIKEEPENPYPNIFSGINDCGYKLFSIWHEKFKNDENNHVANYSFIIRTMVAGHLILDLKHSAYLEFLGKHGIQISRIKTISNCTTKLKDELYLELKESIYTTKN